MVCDNYLEQRKNAARERFKDHTATSEKTLTTRTNSPISWKNTTQTGGSLTS